ncbi:SigE family RNA polymerase sigma factor [Flexivirga caeni]|uniref:SigE family RNA polymerase sigma factor n=1 Tax=Flexivirga caeni TaxID=2294115 RepID=A0A3M9MIT0_9MICO|nr:SigE family RNA polymerase sigma factor [Flexivirga caeni]RNI25441.1 SigE family RNA polymerase sigma factor [Flexivirga caeni]
MTGRDPRADFADFVREATPALLRTAWLITGRVDQSQDLVQAAFVKAYVAWPRIRRAEALAYVRRIVVNEHTDSWRRTRREVPTGEIEARQLAAVGKTSDVDHRDEIVRLLRHLPEQQRKVVVLRYYADLSERQVADALGISLGAVKSAASRGLAALRDLTTLTGDDRR